MSFPKFETEWDGFKGHVALKWDRLTNDELIRVQGNFADLVQIITQKYGEQKQTVEEKLSALYNSYLATKENVQEHSQAMVDQLRRKARDFQEGAKEKIQRIRDESITPTVQKSEEYIKVHPFTAVLGALGIGLVVGGLIGFLSKKD